jgi:hypothetical protein
MGPDVLLNTTGSGFGTIYRNSESEPSIAINPTNPNNIIVVHHQDRWSKSGGAVGIGVAYTLDGGNHWFNTETPSTRCGGGLPGSSGDFERDSDPWVVFSQNGTAYISTEPFNISEDFNESFAVSKSTNGGANWTVSTVLLDPTSGSKNVFDTDKILADPVNANTLYYLGSNYPFGGQGHDVIDPDNSTGKKNQILFSKTTDGGLNWSPAKVINEFSAPKSQQNPQLVMVPPSTLHPNGILVIAFEKDDNALNNFPSSSNNSKMEIDVMRSFDGGGTWTNPMMIQQLVISNLPINEPFDSELGISFSTGVTSLAVDPKNGNLYVTSLDSRYSGVDAIGGMLMMSTDGGNTWNGSVNAVPKTPVHVSATIQQTAVAADGTVGVLFYDFRNDKLGDATFDTDTYLDLFRPTTDSNHPLAFSEEVRLTSTSFDGRQLITRTTIGPGFPGYFTGDYSGLVANDNDFLAAFTVSNQNYKVPENPVNTTILKVDSVNHQEIMFARVKRAAH